MNRRKPMLKIVRASLIGASACAMALSFGAIANTPSFAKTMEKTVEVGGAAMYPSKNIVENALNSKDHTTLVAAVKAAGLVDTLASKGPFTVFAPSRRPKTFLHRRIAQNRSPQPRPINGIAVAISVMNNTFASSGRLAM